MPVSMDGSASVRSGVLETLGEVLYTFRQDEQGPPEELLQLFLGKDDWQTHDENQRSAEIIGGQRWQGTHLPSSACWSEGGVSVSAAELNMPDKESALESFYNDPDRPLICAFNYPAVAMTLGRKRWGELRATYLRLAEHRAVKVRRTLAASLGELAKIIGEENAGRDLVGVWWDAVQSEEQEVRGKAVECVEIFVGALGPNARNEVVRGLLEVWEKEGFRGWREREGIARAIVGLVGSVARESMGLLRGLLKNALYDRVAAVREAGVAAVSTCS